MEKAEFWCHRLPAYRVEDAEETIVRIQIDALRSAAELVCKLCSDKHYVPRRKGGGKQLLHIDFPIDSIPHICIASAIHNKIDVLQEKRKALRDAREARDAAGKKSSPPQLAPREAELGPSSDAAGAASS